MSHVMHVIGDALLASIRPFAIVDALVGTRSARLMSRLIRPHPSSLHVSQQWLDDHEAAVGRKPPE